jgi:hypothetical protein
MREIWTVAKEPSRVEGPTRTYDRSANTLAKNIAVTRTVTQERIQQLSGLVRKNADELADRVIQSSTERSGRE